MYKFMSIAYITIIMGFMVVYITAFVLNLIRAKKVNKEMKKSCRSVKGKIVEIVKEKKRVFIRVEYTSPSNYTKFVDYFDLTEKNLMINIMLTKKLKYITQKLKIGNELHAFQHILKDNQLRLKKALL